MCGRLSVSVPALKGKRLESLPPNSVEIVYDKPGPRHTLTLRSKIKMSEVKVRPGMCLHVDTIPLRFSSFVLC